MEAGEFIQFVRGLSYADIQDYAHRIRRRSHSAANDVAWWRATLLAVDRALMRPGRSRSAGVVAGVAAQAVRGAAESSGVSLPDPDVTSVARSAAGIGRGLVAGPEAEEPVAHLLGIWCPPAGPGNRSGGPASLSLVA